MGVAELTKELTARLKGMGRIAVEGEISGLKRAGSGHLYFGLKDRDAYLNCAIWRSRVSSAVRFELEEGARVVCHGSLDLYAPRGSYSLIVERVEQRGIGELLARLERLKAELRERGWFDRKRPLPRLPRKVGVVTSRDSAGFQDFLRTRSLRWPLYPLRLCHTSVQGSAAARSIADAIARMDASGVDVICLVRGGGSLEDLWCFNELPVAEAIWNSSTPVVSGVGHETDVTLADMVADHRAHTPTDAAQTVLPVRAELMERLERTGGYLMAAVDSHLERRGERLERMAGSRVLRGAEWMLEGRVDSLERAARSLVRAGRSLLDERERRLEQQSARLARRSPARRLEELAGRLERSGTRLVRQAERPLEERLRRLDLAQRGLESISPFRVLERGYSITRRADGRAVRSAEEVAVGDELETLVAGGSLFSRVERLQEGSPDGQEVGDDPGADDES